MSFVLLICNILLPFTLREKIAPRWQRPTALSLHPTISHAQHFFACVSPVTLQSQLVQCDGGPRFPQFREQHLARCFKPWTENLTTPPELGTLQRGHIIFTPRLNLKHEHTEDIMLKNNVVSEFHMEWCVFSLIGQFFFCYRWFVPLSLRNEIFVVDPPNPVHFVVTLSLAM